MEEPGPVNAFKKAVLLDLSGRYATVGITHEQLSKKILGVIAEAW